MRCQLSNNYRQLKLATGEEVIADVLQWANDEDASIVIRAALKIVMSERHDGIRLYALRPWMICCEDMDHLLTVNADQIVGETTPAEQLLKQYIATITEYAAVHQEDVEDFDAEELSTMLDSANSDKIISLFPKNKMH